MTSEIKTAEQSTEALEFGPYVTYRRSEESSNEFVSLTRIALDLADHLLFKNPLESLLPSVVALPENPIAVGSFSMGDLEVKSVALRVQWLTLADYAGKTDLPLEQVGESAERGDLGPVAHGSTGSPMVLWPPEARTLPKSKLPKPGKSIYTATAVVDVGLDLGLDPHTDVQHEYLRLVHALGQPDVVKAHALRMLYRTGFLLEWAAFEVFVKQLTVALLSLHPCLLASKAYEPRTRYDVANVLEDSDDLSSLPSLRGALIGQATSRGIHDLLTALKSSFAADVDPFVAWYRYRGEHRTCSFDALMGLKVRRNALTHDENDSLDTSTDSPTPVTEEEYEITRLQLRALAYSWAAAVSTGKVNPVLRQRT